MAEGSAGAPSAQSCRRCVGPPSSAVAPGCCGGGCGLGRLVRRLRRQGRQAMCSAAARPATSTLRSCQYDPLSYARNFDGSGFGAAAPDDDSDAAQLYYSYTFSSRFVLAPTSSSSAAASSAPSGLTSRPVATSH